jgi:proteasome lid subunit RPN8/RPN11
MLHVLDKVLREIDEHIVSHPPERGGALLGLVEKPVITRFVYDESSAATRSSYRPSKKLSQKVREIELAENIEYKGIIHSHPGNMDRPSAQDERELVTGLRINSHMSFYLVPIVTTSPCQNTQPSEIAVGRGKISFYAAYREQDGRVDIRQKRVEKIPLLNDLERVSQKLGSLDSPDVFLTEHNGLDAFAGRVALEEERELMVIASETYPVLPPVILLTENGSTKQVEYTWPLDVQPESRLLALVKQISTTDPSIEGTEKTEASRSPFAGSKSLLELNLGGYPHGKTRSE